MQTTRSALAAVGVLSVIGLAHMGSAISATSAEDRARMAAEEMAQAASKEFNAFETRLRVAQADTTQPGKTGAAPQPGGPWQWLQESRERFQALMRRLAGERSTTQPWDPVADAGRKAATETVAKTAETKKVEVPSVPAAAKPGQVAGAKPPAEERKLAEARRAEADKRDAEASKGKAPREAGCCKICRGARRRWTPSPRRRTQSPRPSRRSHLLRKRQRLRAVQPRRSRRPRRRAAPRLKPRRPMRRSRPRRRRPERLAPSRMLLLPRRLRPLRR